MRKRFLIIAGLVLCLAMLGGVAASSAKGGSSGHGSNATPGFGTPVVPPCAMPHRDGSDAANSTDTPPFDVVCGHQGIASPVAENPPCAAPHKAEVGTPVAGDDSPDALCGHQGIPGVHGKGKSGDEGTPAGVVSSDEGDGGKGD